MMPFLPGHLRTKVKERLRDMRFAARELRASAQKGDGDPGAAALATVIADFSDTALSAMESVAIGLLSSDPKAHFGRASAYPLSRYFEGGEAQALFARDLYFAAKQILLAKGVSNPRLSEEIFAEAHRLAVKEQKLAAPDHSGTAKDWSLDRISFNAAIMAQAIVRACPVETPRLIEYGTNGRILDTALYTGSALALASAVASFHDDLTADDDVYPGVCAAIDARYAQIERAVSKQNAPEELARVFADLIPHLP